jgi:DNA-binding CsgD family transcriptional regulator
MREVSVRMLHLYRDLARLADIDERSLMSGLPSLVLPDGADPDWIDWDDFIEVVERFEGLAGGPEGVGRAVRKALPSAFPELRAFAAVFVRPIPFFRFVTTRLAGTMYRHMAVETVERLDEDRVRWTQTIPEPYRASGAFHRCTIPMVQVFPRHLDLAEATIESASISARSAAFVVAFPPSPSLTVRGARVSSAASVLAAQLDEAFAHIGVTLRAKPGTSGPTSPGDTHTSAPPAPRATTERGFVHDWAERLALSPRQRDVFSLLVEGRANKDIAAALRCSERNIEFHVGRILRSASVSSRAELLVKVLGARA